MQGHRSNLAVRPGEVEEVAAGLRATGPAARTVLVTGTVGTGKTAVLEQARWAVVQEGGRVLRLRWEVAEGPGGTAAFVDAICAALAKIPDGRLPARVARVHRMRAWSAAPGNEIVLLSALAEVVADAVQYVHFAVILDDVRSMPMGTASALGLLLRAFRPTGVPMVLAGRPMDPEQVTGAQLLATADRLLDLQLLSADAVGALIVRWLGRPAGLPLGTPAAGRWAPPNSPPTCPCSPVAGPNSTMSPPCCPRVTARPAPRSSPSSTAWRGPARPRSPCTGPTGSPTASPTAASTSTSAATTRTAPGCFPAPRSRCSSWRSAWPRRTSRRDSTRGPPSTAASSPTGAC
ncbi:ATP-binding protein [Streptomyces sp. NBC_00343]|uniref:ATP-binding protein n=1 Tax=Streptomyces sp. NBC_00343 TaxID=2975719 RepID=UPI003FA7DEA0